jgi:uncharacterized protein (DUF1330 family)
MSRKRIIWTTVLLAIAAGAIFCYKEYTRTNQDMANARADLNLTAAELIRDYQSNDSNANKKYNGKVIEVKGSVKRIEKDEKGYFTVVLGDSSISSVRCSMDTIHQNDAASLTEGSSAIIRGACTGFNKDETGLVGSDVILNRCAIINTKK